MKKIHIRNAKGAKFTSHEGALQFVAYGQARWKSRREIEMIRQPEVFISAPSPALRGKIDLRVIPQPAIQDANPGGAVLRTIGYDRRTRYGKRAA